MEERAAIPENGTPPLPMPPPPPNPVRALQLRIQPRIWYIHSEPFLRYCSLLPIHSERERMVWELVRACGLDKWMSIKAPPAASIEHLSVYHSADYIAALSKVGKAGAKEHFSLKELEAHGLVDDCHPFDGVLEYCRAVTGGTLAAASSLCMGLADVAINWAGGRHHAKKGQAAGFCFVNDAVLGCLRLLRTFSRVLYIDLDLHHGDGVEEAFYSSDRVMTISIHKRCRGFFPGSGGAESRGSGVGWGFTINCPLDPSFSTCGKDFIPAIASCESASPKPACISDSEWLSVVWHVLDRALPAFKPAAIVVQCGADTLDGDPMGGFMLTPAAPIAVVRRLRALNLPMLLLGGGGYNDASTARCWTLLTAAACADAALCSLPRDIPEHNFFPRYGPDFLLCPYSFAMGSRKIHLGSSLCAFDSEKYSASVREEAGSTEALSGSPKLFTRSNCLDLNTSDTQACNDCLNDSNANTAGVSQKICKMLSTPNLQASDLIFTGSLSTSRSRSMGGESPISFDWLDRSLDRVRRRVSAIESKNISMNAIEVHNKIESSATNPRVWNPSSIKNPCLLMGPIKIDRPISISARNYVGQSWVDALASSCDILSCRCGGSAWSTQCLETSNDRGCITKESNLPSDELALQNSACPNDFSSGVGVKRRYKFKLVHADLAHTLRGRASYGQCS